MNSVAVKSRMCLAVLLGGLLVGGCAATRSEVKIASPVASTMPSGTPTKGTVYLRSVKDARNFTANPRDPSEPSLGTEGGTDDTRARAFGRKRGGYGQAMGDVLLAPGQTVTGLVKDNAVAALQQAGYAVVSAPAANATPMDVTINKLWMWFTPGFVQVTLSGKAAIDLATEGAATPTSVEANWQEGMGVVVESDWVKGMEALMLAWRTNATGQIGSQQTGAK